MPLHAQISAGQVKHSAGIPCIFDFKNGANIPEDFRPFVVDADPVFNSSTHKIARGFTVEADKVRRTATAIALTPAELDALADSTESANLVALWNDWDNITANQQKRVLKRVFKDFLKTRGLI